MDKGVEMDTAQDSTHLQPRFTADEVGDKWGPAGNVILLRGACLWLIAALILAWCIVGLAFGVPVFKSIFPGKYTRVVQAHLDLLIMSALILGVYATRTALPWHVRWAMVIGAFTNSSLFALQAMFPSLDSATPPQGFWSALFQFYLFASLLTTSYGFGRAAVLVFKSTWPEQPARADGRAAFRLNTAAVRHHAWKARRNLMQTGSATRQDPLVLWLIFTGLSLFAFFFCWFFGLAQQMLTADRTGISLLIVGLYVLSSAHCFWRVSNISREAAAAEVTSRFVRGDKSGSLPTGVVSAHIAEVKQKASLQGGGKIDQSILLRVLAEKLRGSNAFGAFAGDALMKLGLFGTIVGFIMMLAPMSGLDTENQAAVKASMSMMSEGMAVAMYTTLTGLVGSILLKIQYAFVDTATDRIFMDAAALTEVHVIPALERQASASQ